MFDNEDPAVASVNWSSNGGGGIPSFEAHNVPGNNYDQLMMKVNHGDDFVHDSRMDPNDKIQEWITTFYADSATSNTAEVIIEFRDANDTGFYWVKVINLNVYFWNDDTSSFLTTAAKTIDARDEWHEIKIYFHNANSDIGDNTLVEVFVDGYRFWYDSGTGTLVNNATGKAELAKLSNKLSYIRIYTANTVGGDEWYFGGFITKDWADMVLSDDDGTGDNLPLMVPLIEGNDLATFIKLKPYISNIELDQSYSESGQCSLTYHPLDVNDAMENIIVDTKDNDYTHFTYDNKALIFLQQSQLLYHYYKATAQNDVLTDSAKPDSFVTAGIQAGDKLWLFRRDFTSNNPYNIDSVAANTLTVTPNITSGGLFGSFSYMITRGQDLVWSSSAGDYVLQGRFKNKEYMWSDVPQVNLLLLDDLYIAVQHHTYCKATRFFRKYIDEIAEGHYVNPADQYVNGLQTVGNYAGIFEDQAFIPNLADIDDEDMLRPITKVWNPTLSFYDAALALAETLNLQMMSYTDYSFRNERVIFYRNRLDQDQGSPLLSLYAGDVTVSEDEDSRYVISSDITKGTRDFIDRAVVIGSTDEYGILLLGDEPPNYDIDGFTRDVILNDNAIRTQVLVNNDAAAVYRDLSRTPEEGTITTPPLSFRETWYSGLYTDDDDIDDYYERLTGSYGYFRGDSDWFNNVFPGSSIDEKDRTTQGHLYRKPFSLVGEVGRYYHTATKYYNFIVQKVTLKYNNNSGMRIVLEPNVLPYNVAKNLADARREIDWVAEQFKDPLVQRCYAEPLPKEFCSIQPNFNLGLVATTGYAFTPGGAGSGIGKVDFPPFLYTDEVGPAFSQPYAYAFYSTTTAPPNTWGNWVLCPYQGGGALQNFITDIDATNYNILLNNDPGGIWGYSAPSNFVYLQPAGGSGNYYILIVLVFRNQLTGVDYHYVPRQPSPMIFDQSGNYWQDEENSIIKSPVLGVYAFP